MARNNLAQCETGNACADLIDNADQAPTRRIRYARCLRMDALARQYVRQARARGQNLHPHFTTPRLRALLFSHLQCIGPAVVCDDDSRVSHGPAAPRDLQCRVCNALLRPVTIVSDACTSDGDHAHVAGGAFF